MRHALRAAGFFLLVGASLIPLAACGHRGASTTLPPTSAQSAHRGVREVSSADLHAGGDWAPAIAYMGGVGNQPVGRYTDAQTLPSASSLFGTAPTIGNIYYCGMADGTPDYTLDAYIFPANSSSEVTTACAAAGLLSTGMGAHSVMPDFVGYGLAMSFADYPSYSSQRKAAYGEPVEFPLLYSTISFAYNKADLTNIPTNQQLKLSVGTYCGIASGKIDNWNDPAIVADNGGVFPVATNPPGEAVTITNFFHHDDVSGTNLYLQQYLLLNCPAGTWDALGAAPNWLGPMGSEFSPKSGDPGVAHAIAATPYSIGIINAAYGLSMTPHLGQAQLQNRSGNYASPTSASALAAAVENIALSQVVAGASDAAGYVGAVSLGSSRPDCVFYLNPRLLTAQQFPDPNAYPIVGVSYLFYYGKNSVHLSDVTTLVQFLAGHGSTTRPTLPIGYHYVDSSITDEVNNAITGGTPSSSFRDINGNPVSRASPCLQQP